MLGLTSRSQINDTTRRYEIESVRQPKERIDMYRNDPFDRERIQTGAKMIGPYDVALLRLTTGVTFTPGKLAPVRLKSTSPCNVVPLSFIICQVCLNPNVRLDKKVYVTGFGTMGNINPKTYQFNCFTNIHGPQPFQMYEFHLSYYLSAKHTCRS